MIGYGRAQLHFTTWSCNEINPSVVQTLEWKLKIINHRLLDHPSAEDSSIYVFTRLCQNSSQIFTVDIQFSQDSMGNKILSSQDAEELGWRAETCVIPACVFHWDEHHFNALRELYCILGFDPNTNIFAELSLSQLGDAFHINLVSRFTSSSTDNNQVFTDDSSDM